jgi:hypothetical protein
VAVPQPDTLLLAVLVGEVEALDEALDVRVALAVAEEHALTVADAVLQAEMLGVLELLAVAVPLDDTDVVADSVCDVVALAVEQALAVERR